MRQNGALYCTWTCTCIHVCSLIQVHRTTLCVHTHTHTHTHTHIHTHTHTHACTHTYTHTPATRGSVSREVWTSLYPSTSGTSPTYRSVTTERSRLTQGYVTVVSFPVHGAMYHALACSTCTDCMCLLWSVSAFSVQTQMAIL